MGIVLNIIIQNFKVNSILHCNSSLMVAVDLVVREGAIARKTQPEPVVGMVRLVPPVGIASAEHPLRMHYWAIRRVVFLE